MNWLIKGWTLLNSAKSTQASVQKAIALAKNIKSTIDNLGTADFQQLRQRAESGNRLAQYDLGECYSTGAGVPRDDAEAFQWFKLAAQQNYPPAQTALGTFYALGRGCDRNLVEALHWIERAAAQRHPNALRLQVKLKSRMSPDQIAQALQQTQTALVPTPPRPSSHS